MATVSPSASPSSQTGSLPPTKEIKKRSYRACLHCRSRKAKCDLGDINCPSSPPCSRCKRESKECVFLPSRRGGNSKSRKQKFEAEEALHAVKPKEELGLYSGPNSTDSQIQQQLPVQQQLDSADGHSRVPGMDQRYPSGPQSFIPPYQTPQPGGTQLYQHGYPPIQSRQQQPMAHGGDYARFSVQNLLEESPNARHASLNDPSPSSQCSPADTVSSRPTPQSVGSAGLPLGSKSGSLGSLKHSKTHPSSTSPAQKRRRLHLNPPLHAADPSSIVVADMQNESDALHILAMASEEAGKGGANGKRKRERNGSGTDSGESQLHGSRRQSRIERASAEAPDLNNFALVKLGIISPDEVARLTDAFYHYHHHIFPMTPVSRIPRNRADLAIFAQKESYLLAAIVIIVSRHDQAQGMREVHDRSWAVMRGWISDITCLGAPANIGLVEGLLLLAENLPRDPPRGSAAAAIIGKRAADRPEELHATGFGEDAHASESRQSWMLIGMAVRVAYGLELDKIALTPLDDAERTMELERVRVLWTYVYLFDRHVSLRLGKAFWSRGPALCFHGFANAAQTGPVVAEYNFPYLAEVKADNPEGMPPQEDFASLIQAYVELTQSDVTFSLAVMSNAHDILYSSPSRTKYIVVQGEYFKYLDDFARSLQGFKDIWKTKRWTVFPLTDAVWAMYSYVKLYACAFSFQAHVERSSMRAEEDAREREHNGIPDDGLLPPVCLFPRGAAASPDQRYIYQSVDAARELLLICVDSLHPGGALPFLPSRFLLWFVYGALFLLKALYSGAMLKQDTTETLKLVDRLCLCLASSSSDKDHAAVRYARQLGTLCKKLHETNVAGVDSPPVVPSRRLPGVNETQAHQFGPLETPVFEHLGQPALNGQAGASQHTNASQQLATPMTASSQSWISELPQNHPPVQQQPSMRPPPPVWMPPQQQQQQQQQQRQQQQEQQQHQSLNYNAQQFSQQPHPTEQKRAFQPVIQPPQQMHPPPGSHQQHHAFQSTQPQQPQGSIDYSGFDTWLGDPTAISGENAAFDLDLVDFWNKVGPGEAQGGFPFR